MNKKVLLGAIIAVTCLSSLAYAYKKEEAKFNRVFTLDKVDIEIMMDKSIENVMEDVTYDYSIKLVNEGQPCFIRVYIDENQYEVNSQWIKIGDYYYYPESVESNEEIEFSDTIHFLSIEENEDVVVNVYSEAVQSAHFELDLEAEDPFADVEIQSFETGGNV